MYCAEHLETIILQGFCLQEFRGNLGSDQLAHLVEHWTTVRGSRGIKTPAGLTLTVLKQLKRKCSRSAAFVIASKNG